MDGQIGVKKTMEFPWLRRFWNDHGDRVFFMGLATCFGVGFYFFSDMTGEGKTILIAVATLCLNKARSTPKDGPKD